MAMEPVISLRGVSRIYYTEEVETHAVSEVSLHIDRGEFFAINGPSGCGKSTLMSIMGLLDRPTTGEYRLNGHDVNDLNESARARTRNREIGFVFQSFNLIGDLSVYENVELPLTYRGTPAAARRDLVSEALARVDMQNRSKHHPGQLSGGQQQRVAVARAIAGRPEIMLADEPTGNLDSGSGDTVMGILRELNQEGTTICIVTHNDDYARYATRGISLLDGALAA